MTLRTRFPVASRFRIGWLCLAAATALLAVAGPSARAAGPDRYPYRITCTVGMVADIVSQVAGDKAAVTGIIGAGVDPHLYQATRSDIAALMRADMVFYNGLMLEGKMADMLVQVARNRPVYAVTEGIDRARLLSPPEFEGHYDPHVWMDPVLWKDCTRMVAKTLSEFDPDHAAYYQSNFKCYAKELDALHAYGQRVLATVPEARRVLITAHDAFNYFGRAYHIEVRGIQGISTESEAGIADINRLVDLIVTRKIAAVFVETSVSDKNVEALTEGARSRGAEVAVGGRLFSDAMGQPGTYEGTYIGMLDHNVTTIARALGGKAPPRGMQGKLTRTTGQQSASTIPLSTD